MQFAARVKHDIAAAGGLVELDWYVVTYCINLK